MKPDSKKTWTQIKEKISAIHPIRNRQHKPEVKVKFTPQNRHVANTSKRQANRPSHHASRTQ